MGSPGPGDAGGRPATDRSASPSPYRLVQPGMRAILWIGAFLTFVAGASLYLLTERTDRYFAWTIKVPMSAAFLGAFYFTACVMACASARQREWSRARVGVPGVTAFLWLTLIATLLHLSLFHLHAGSGTARGAAWAWLAIYVLDPIALSILWFLQVRVPGRDRPSERPLPAWYRVTLVLESFLLVLVGITLFVAPSAAPHVWPWPLTPLTSRMSAAWLLGLGITAGTAAGENDWRRIRPAVAGLIALVAFQSIALMRFGGDVLWSAPIAWAYAAALGVNLVLGVVGAEQARTRP